MNRHSTFRIALPHQRRGSMIPAVAIALLVVGGCMALTLDQLWLVAAHSEVLAAAEAGALAGAARLANDDTLQTDLDVTSRSEAVRQAASTAAQANRAAGRTVHVDTEPFGNVRLGQIVIHENSGEPQFLETDHQATSVLVTAHCDRRNGNPVSLFFPSLTGQLTANVLARAEATVNNRITGVRPLDNATVPGWPLGVLESHADPRRTDTWLIQVEGKGGADRYRFNAQSKEIEEAPDGIPEILLFAPHDEDDDDRPCNMSLVDLGSGLNESELERQFRQGWSWQDLQQFGSELQLGNGIEMNLSSTTDFPPDVEDGLAALVGQAKLIVLYREATLTQGEPAGHVLATRLAAGRIMRITSTSKGTEMLMQPAVVATRTALAAETSPGTPSQDVKLNPYVYRVSLTY